MAQGIVRELIAKIGFQINRQDIKKVESAFNRIKKAIASIGAAFVAFRVLSSFKDLILNTTKASLEIDNLSKRLGVSTQFVETFRFAAQKTGVQIGRATRAIETFSKRIDEARFGTRDAVLGFGLLNIQLTKTNGTVKGTEQLFFEVAKSIAGIENPAKRARLATKVFGESSAELLPLLLTLGQNFKSTQQLLDAYGVTLTDVDRKQDLVFQKGLIDLNIIFLGIKRTITREVVPALNEVIGRIKQYFLVNKDIIRQNDKDTWSFVAGGLKKIDGVITGAINDFFLIKKVFSELNPTIQTLLKLLSVGAFLWALFSIPVVGVALGLGLVAAATLDVIRFFRDEESVLGELIDLYGSLDEALSGPIDKTDKFVRSMQVLFGAFQSLLALIKIAALGLPAIAGAIFGRPELLDEIKNDFKEFQKGIEKLRGFESPVERQRRRVREAAEGAAEEARTPEEKRVRQIIQGTPGGPLGFGGTIPSGLPFPSGSSTVVNSNINLDIKTGPTTSSAKDIADAIIDPVEKALGRTFQKAALATTVQGSTP